MLRRKLSVRWIVFFVGDQTGSSRSSRSFLSQPALSRSLHPAESKTLDDSLSPFVRGFLENARTPPGLHRSCRGYPPERNGFPPQSLRSDCARSGKIHAGGQLISHPVLR